MKFRILTQLSRLDFGQFATLRVRDVLIIKKENYLAWCYYNMSHISFNSEILNLLGITDDLVIHKPGIDKLKFDNFLNIFNSKKNQIWQNEIANNSYKLYREVQRKRKTIKIIKTEASRISANAISKKLTLQGINHGR